MVSFDPDMTRYLPRRALVVLAVLLLVELLGVGVLYKHMQAFSCRSNWPGEVCSAASGSLVAVYCLLGALTLLAVLRPAPFQALLSRAGHAMWPLAINALGVLIVLIPATFLKNGTGSTLMVLTLALWSLGMIVLTVGLALYAAPVAQWRRFWAETRTDLPIVIATGLAVPFLATLIRPLWQLETLASLTFNAVVGALHLLGYEPYIDVDRKIIGANDFYINVAPVCSGIEGIALVTLFVTLYLALFRKELRFPRVFWLYPLGILTSALFNVVRITVLVIIGIQIDPELAVGGFHSHAGWLLFTLIALGIVVVAQAVPGLQRVPARALAGAGVGAGASSVAASGPAGAPQTAFFRDPMVARILPFAVFMFSALLAQAFSNSPGLVYPLRVVAMVAVVAAFLPLYLRLTWRLDPVALGAGVVIGLGWVLIPYAPEDLTPSYGTLTGGLLLGWMILRGIGTVLLVPVIEELFFRDYLEGKLLPRLGPVLAALVTAGLFAVLHDRWAEAFVAGLIFSWVMRRHGRVGDAILAHAVANLIVFAVAYATQQMHII